MTRTSLLMVSTMGLAFTLAAGAQELASDSQLPVKPALTPAAPDPMETAARVSNAIEESSITPASGVTVSTHAGTIVLSGQVDSELERATAISSAQKAAAGSRVSSSIEIRAPQLRSTSTLQAEQQSLQLVRDVEAALKADTRTANLGVLVSASDAHVIVLQGLLSSRLGRSMVQEIVSRVKGVTRIDNRLELSGN